MMSLKVPEGLFSCGDRVVCAVSGGADSVALLTLLCERREELGILLRAAHFNHKLRGEESERDEAFVRQLCQNLDVPLFLGSGDVRSHAQHSGKGIEDAARELRYAFLNSLDCDKLATAHTADDHAETVLLHLIRGSGLRGLCGIALQRGRLVRPLLYSTRQQVEAFLNDRGLAWVDDSSNFDSEFTRNRVRMEILPRMKRENPQLLQAILAQSEIFRQEDALLDQMAGELLEQHGQNGRYDCEGLLCAPEALQRRALRLMVRGFLPKDVSRKHIELMGELLRNPGASASLSLPQGIQMRKSYGKCWLERPTGSFAPTCLTIPGETVLPELGLKICCRITKNLQNFANNHFHFVLKYDMIAEQGIMVRPRQVSDRLTLGCGKSVKKWFIERKIPVFERDRLPIFVCGDQVCAVSGLGVDRAFVPTSEETVLEIRVEPY